MRPLSTPLPIAIAAAALLLGGCASEPEPAVDDVASSTTEEEAAVEDAPTEDSGDAAESEVAGDDAAMEDMQDDEEMHDDEEEAAAAADADRVVEIEMVDIAFSMDELEVSAGETVLFVFENTGEAVHEAVIGDLHLQEEHEEDMAAGGDHDDMGHHDDVSAISLQPGESGELLHQFTEAGEVWIGCHVPGHWPAGMRTRVTVS